MKEQQVKLTEMTRDGAAELQTLVNQGWTVVSVTASPAPLTSRSVYGQELDPVGVSLVLLERVHR